MLPLQITRAWAAPTYRNQGASDQAVLLQVCSDPCKNNPKKFTANPASVPWAAACLRDVQPLLVYPPGAATSPAALRAVRLCGELSLLIKHHLSGQNEPHSPVARSLLSQEVGAKGVMGSGM